MSCFLVLHFLSASIFIPPFLPLLPLVSRFPSTNLQPFPPCLPNLSFISISVFVCLKLFYVFFFSTFLFFASCFSPSIHPWKISTLTERSFITKGIQSGVGCRQAVHCKQLGYPIPAVCAFVLVSYVNKNCCNLFVRTLSISLFLHLFLLIHWKGMLLVSRSGLWKKILLTYYTTMVFTCPLFLNVKIQVLSGEVIM